MSRIGQVKSARGFTKFFKEIAGPTQSNAHDYLGKVSVPLRVRGETSPLKKNPFHAVAVDLKRLFHTLKTKGTFAREKQKNQTSSKLEKDFSSDMLCPHGGAGGHFVFDETRTVGVLGRTHRGRRAVAAPGRPRVADDQTARRAAGEDDVAGRRPGRGQSRPEPLPVRAVPAHLHGTRTETRSGPIV